MFWFEAVHPETGESVEVEACWFPAHRGQRDRFGAPLEPDEREEIVICRVWNRFGEVMPDAALERHLLARAWRWKTARG